MLTFYHRCHLDSFPWQRSDGGLLTHAGGGGGSIFHNLLFVSATVVSITNLVSLKETAITSRLSINELYENIIITFSEAYQTSPGSTLLSLLKRVQLFKLCTFFPHLFVRARHSTEVSLKFISIEAMEIKQRPSWRPVQVEYVQDIELLFEYGWAP